MVAIDNDILRSVHLMVYLELWSNETNAIEKHMSDAF